MFINPNPVLHLNYSGNNPCKDLAAFTDCFNVIFKEIQKHFPDKKGIITHENSDFSGNPRDGYDAYRIVEIKLGDLHLKITCSRVFPLGFYIEGKTVLDRELGCLINELPIRIEPTCTDSDICICITIIEKELKKRFGFIFSDTSHIPPELESKYPNFWQHKKKSAKNYHRVLAKKHNYYYDFSYSEPEDIEEYLNFIPDKTMVKTLVLVRCNLEKLPVSLSSFTNLKVISLLGNPIKQSMEDMKKMLNADVRINI